MVLATPPPPPTAPPPPPLPACLLQGATATLGIYVDAGSVYETPASTGAARSLRWQPGGQGSRAADECSGTALGSPPPALAAGCRPLAPAAHAPAMCCVGCCRREPPAGVHGVQDHQAPHAPAPGARGGGHWRQRAGLGCAGLTEGGCGGGVWMVWVWWTVCAALHLPRYVAAEALEQQQRALWHRALVSPLLARACCSLPRADGVQH